MFGVKTEFLENCLVWLLTLYNHWLKDMNSFNQRYNRMAIYGEIQTLMVWKSATFPKCPRNKILQRFKIQNVTGLSNLLKNKGACVQLLAGIATVSGSNFKLAMALSMMFIACPSYVGYWLMFCPLVNILFFYPWFSNLMTFVRMFLISSSISYRIFCTFCSTFFTCSTFLISYSTFFR